MPLVILVFCILTVCGLLGYYLAEPNSATGGVIGGLTAGAVLWVIAKLTKGRGTWFNRLGQG